MSMGSFALIFSATFILALASFAYRLYTTGKYLRAAARAGKEAQAQGSDAKGIQDAVAQALIAEKQAQTKSAPAKVGGRIAPLVVLAVLAFFFTMAMKVLATDFSATTAGGILKAGVYGFLVGSAAVVVFRSIAMVLAPKTEPVWIDVVADPASKWAGLEGNLLLASFGIVFISLIALMGRLFIVHPNT